ncbi:MAG: hypothetical protein ACREH8_15010 [Opitutaceae bacterium]
MFVLTPELSQEIAEIAEPGHQNSAASASSCKNGFVFWLFAIGEPLVPGAIREKGRELWFELCALGGSTPIGISESVSISAHQWL